MLTNFILEVTAMSAATKNIAITNLGQISINVHDLERASAFYRDVLGLPLLFTAPNLAFFDCGGVRLMLGRAETPEFDHPSSILYFRVTEIKVAHETLLEMGVQFLNAPQMIAPMPAYDLWMTAFRDSEGNIMQLMSEVPR